MSTALGGITPPAPAAPYPRGLGIYILPSAPLLKYPEFFEPLVDPRVGVPHRHYAYFLFFVMFGFR